MFTLAGNMQVTAKGVVHGADGLRFFYQDFGTAWRDFGFIPVTGRDLTTQFNGKCLDADTNTAYSNGGRAQLWSCNGSSQQRWVWNSDGTGSIKVGLSGKCLDADTNTAGVNGGRVQLWDCNGSLEEVKARRPP